MQTDNLNYIILNVSEVSYIDFSEVLEDSIETLRYSIDGSKTFVNWEGMATPSFIQSLTTAEGPYNHDQMLQILSTPEWDYVLN